MMKRHRRVGDDRHLAAGAQLGDPLAERRQEAAADRDVIGALAQRDIHGDRFAGTERHGHGLAASAVGFDCKNRRRLSITSSLMASCGTSRDSTVMPAWETT